VKYAKLRKQIVNRGAIAVLLTAKLELKGPVDVCNAAIQV
jgi:hypothetical protein